MSQVDADPAGETATGSGWRTKVGTVLLILGLVVIPLVVLSLPLFGVSGSNLAAIGGGLAAAAEGMMIAGAAVAGKEGFAQIKAKLFGYLKPLAPPQTVSRMRYRIGLVLFVLPLLFGFVSFYLGDWIPGFEGNVLVYGLISDVMLAVSLFVLGGDFWDKLRSLFVYNAQAQFS